MVNSVHFSNHTGYKEGWTGDVLNGDQLRSILKGLEKNDLTSDIGHVLTGYIGSESFLNAVLDVLSSLRKQRPSVRFVCDPVLGDENHFYVPNVGKELVRVYREKVIPLANIVTPNQFEVEQLTGLSIGSLEDAKRACVALLDMGPSLIFITSLNLQKDVITIVAAQRRRHDTHNNDTTTITDDTDDEDEFWAIDSPLYEGHFGGTGDLTAALLLGHTAANNDDVKKCMEQVIGTMHAVIRRTHETAGETVFSKELKLIASKKDIENPPPCLFEARRI